MGFLQTTLNLLGLETKGTGTYTSRDLASELWGRGNSGGPTVNHATALQVSAVLCCARVIAEGLAQVPCKLYRSKAGGGREEAESHPLHRLLHRAPNDWQTSFEFREQLGLHLALTNNAYVYVIRNSKGQPIELLPYQPGCVAVTRHDDHSLTYRLYTDDNRTKFIDVPEADIWHLRGPSWNGWQGLDAVDLARKSIGLSMSTEDFGTKFFENSARPSGLLSSKIPLTPEQQTELRESWNRQQSGSDNTGKTAVLTGDLAFQPLQSTADDSQWMESRRYQTEEICRHFRVLPIMAMQSGQTSYASVEQLFLAHLTHTLMPWYERFEQSAERALLTDADRAGGHYIKLNGNALLRGSTAERTAYFGAMLTQGVMTVNEVRELEDMDRSSDPAADKLRPAANIFGTQPEPQTSINGDGVSK